MASKNNNEIPQPTYENGIWKGVKVDMPEGYFKLGERIFNQFKENPDFVGQIDGLTGQEDTYKRMGDASIRCALWLQKQGIKKGDFVGLCSKNQLDCCIPWFSSLYLGTIFSTLSNKDLDAEIARLYIETRNPKVLFVDEDNAELIIKTAKNIGYSMPIVIFGEKIGSLSFTDILKAQNDKEVQNFICVEIKAKDPVVIINTTGTTSSPKGVLHSYISFANMLNYYQNDASPSIVLGCSGMSCINGIRTYIRSIVFKATMIINNNPSGVELCKLIEKYKVTRLWMVVWTVVKLMKVPDLSNYDLSSIEMVTYGGGVADKEDIAFVLKLFNTSEVYPRYSSTESGAMLTCKLDPTKLNSCGKVMANVEMKIVDPNTHKILGPNEEGEIYCRTPKLMIGYWNDPKATEKAVDSEGWYRTGDLGYYDNDGEFFIFERINDVITNWGRRVSSSVIANVIKEVPGVAEVAVVPRPHVDYFEVPMAFITTVPGARVTEADVNRAVEENFPDYLKLRGGIRFLETMPYTCSGKINKRKLRAIAKISF